MSLDFLLTIAAPVFQSAAMLVGVWIAKKITTPTDHARAELLARIAQSAAALVVMNNPGASWANLLDMTVREISNAAGVPTTNHSAITRAAAAALVPFQKG
jgi:hypothetical protein